ncbi:MAG: SHOCT domain-containing protein [Candidatus Tectomicrobia bacterium]|nr:SHOCT domain-containing protein [Candidatus Tectomicrobia bacterium]
MGPGHYGWGDMWWGGMWIFPLIMLTIMLIVVYLMFGRGGWRPPWHGDRSETALDILKKRYAAGEISKDEFEQVKKDLVS